MSTKLKTTYRAPAPAALTPLPSGWTEHKAPTGHVYYYNASTKQSTYTRPTSESEDLQIDFNATQPDQVVQASFKVMDEFNRRNPPMQMQQSSGAFTGGRAYQDRSRQNRYQDRPKSKKPITNCEPWILVTTKFKRRFVHNVETKESLWKFPSEVMMAVIEMEKVEWQAKKDSTDVADNVSRPPATAEAAPVPKPSTNVPEREQPAAEYDSDSYEEVEVTDDEGDPEAIAKRQRMEEDYSAPKGPMEFDEDDIAWQLAQMEEEENIDDADFDAEQEAQDDDEGLPLTAEDSAALFRSLLDDMHINPYSPFDMLLEDSNAVMLEDDRWTALTNMASRRTAFAAWSADRIRELRAKEAATAASKKKQDPRAAYLNFLYEFATPKLYWPEFKRKYKKESEMKDLNVTDKDREKLYREYISKIKANESDRRKDFVALLKSLPPSEIWNQQTRLDNLPETVLKDLRFYIIRDRKSRDDLLEAHLSTLTL